jgi:hypothetical protein
MKELLTKDKALLKLANDIKKHSDLETLSDSKPKCSNLSKDQAARFILQTWRKKKIKDALLKSPFNAYRSMIAPDDKQLQLSSAMYGHHVAELISDAKEQIDNPLINPAELYHRSMALNNPVLNALFKEFNIQNFEQYDCLPISLLANNPIEDVLALFEKSLPGLQLVKKEPYSIALLLIPKINEEAKNKLKNKIKNMGLVASSWEIAENIKHSEIPVPAHTIKIQLDPNLPKTKEELLDSEIMAKLRRVSVSGKKYPTQLLAICLKKLLSDLPPNISSGAIQRIATMVDLTNTFYTYHYPRYALCIHSVLHEISLALIENKDSAFMEKEYTRFRDESAATLASTLRIEEKNLEKSTFLATASISGASACAVAMRIASKMNTPNDEKPKVKIFKPCYYELPNTFNLDSTNDANAADVLMISVGPIVNPEGLTPGMDINLFIKRHIIDANRTKPVTIIVDATTALYKNIELNKEAQQLIATGQLSVIIHESHQKFGLIHTDQAQYGRVFGWCSKEHFSEETLQEVEKNTKEDFFTHPDMRIGAFVSTRCEETLEHIKRRHFANGAILRNMLVKHSIASAHVEPHDDMQQNLDELYFLTDTENAPGSYISNMEYAGYGALEYRSSFGHYALTSTGVEEQRRISPDASDTIDNLITASHMRLSRQYSYSTRTMLQLLINSSTPNKASLPLEEQILVTGLLHNISSFCPIVPSHFNEVVYQDQSLTAVDKKKIMTSESSAKNIYISKTVHKGKDPVYYIGFHSHGTTFRQIQIKDPYILGLVRAGNISSPQNRNTIKTYIHSLQENYFPDQANLPMIYAAVGNALEKCPSLRNRPSIININIWLSALKKSILEKYQPINATEFLKAIKNLHDSNNLTLDGESIQSLLVFLSQVNLSSISPVALANKNFIKAIKKVIESNQEILEHLKKSPNKFKTAHEASKIYLNSSFNELHNYYSNANPTESQRAHLMASIKNAEEGYIKVLAVDRSTFSKLARYLLMMVTNFIAGLTLGAAHYINYKTTGNVAFFSCTRTENKLRTFHREFEEELQQPTP